MPSPESRVRFWRELTAPEIRAAAPRAVAVLPLAATEQHGPHLATGTDALLNELLQRGLAESPPPRGELVILPTVPLGASEHHTPFGGTLSAPPILYTRMLAAMLRGLLAQGHTRIFALNSHGGNEAPLATALAEIAAECTRRGVLVGGASYWTICGPHWRTEIPDLKQPTVGHAGEIETSMLMAARPDLVPGPPPPDCPFPDHESSGWNAALSFPAFTAHGHIGAPAAASAEKGRRLFAIAVRELGRFFADFSQRPLPRDRRSDPGSAGAAEPAS
ncbi:MAG: creatininase family protein [Opitutaceae bacterium]